MDRELKDINIGQAIEERRKELKITKSELARRIGIPQQHINRMLDRDTMETKRLVKVSEVLDFNFFGLFCPCQPTKVSGYLSAVTLQGHANNVIGAAPLAAELAIQKNKAEELEKVNTMLRERIEDLKGQIARLDANLKDKDTIIKLLTPKSE